MPCPLAFQRARLLQAGDRRQPQRRRPSAFTGCACRRFFRVPFPVCGEAGMKWQARACGAARENAALLPQAQRGRNGLRAQDHSSALM